VTAPGFANMLIRVHRVDGSTSAYIDMTNRPITFREWKFYELRAPVDRGSNDIEFGMQLYGSGVPWIDNITLDFSMQR
jgi:hypothetical protein